MLVKLTLGLVVKVVPVPVVLRRVQAFSSASYRRALRIQQLRNQWPKRTNSESVIQSSYKIEVFISENSH